MNNTIDIANLIVKYNSFTAVDNLSFNVAKGEIFAIIGPNGSGKTSTAECITGLRKPAGGTIKVFGLSPDTHRKEILKKTGVQLQHAEYPPKIKVSEICRLFSSFYENPVSWKTLIEQLGLSHKQNSYVSKLSGGEKQKLSILLALLPKPELLILDELTTGLDPEARRSMWTNLKNIQNSGVSILLVSHFMDEVEYLADRLMLMQSGKSRFCGSLEQFDSYTKSLLPEQVWQNCKNLEDKYLALMPKHNTLNMEAI